MLRTVLTALTSAAVFAGAAQALEVQDQAVVKSGALKGVVQGDVAVFKGIPFAAPPVGPFRWKPPQPATPWTGIRNASDFGPICYQSGGVFLASGRQSEDCLTLNIFTPAQHKGHTLPVMVWIHGGGFVAGSGSNLFYDGTAFARDGVVLVSVNYRLGRLGFFAHPALHAESPKGPLGNYGLMDQVAALKWVRNNISAFGGDRNNVTVFGESAGGISVNLLLANPAFQGLFDKVISESGFGRFDAPPIAKLEEAGATDAASWGVTGSDAKVAAELREVPVDKLLGGFKGLDDANAPRPMIDGVMIKERVDDAFAKGHQLRVPYMLGGNSFEASLFGPATKAHPERQIASTGLDPAKAVALFGDGDALKAAYTISTETMITEPNRFLATKDTQAGAKVWLYHFSYVTAAQRSTAPGTAHGGELGYVFETLPLRPMKFGAFEFPAATDQDLATAKSIHAYWVAFAKTGDPASAGGPLWPAFKPPSGPLMEFGAEGQFVRNDFEASRLDVIQSKVSSAKSISK